MGQSLSNPPSYVLQADRNFITIRGADHSLVEELVNRGFTAKIANEELRIDTSSKFEKAKVLEALRDLGLHFVRGREWSPAEIFEWLRDQKLIQGSFKEISWSNPSTWHIRENLDRQAPNLRIDR